MIFNLDLKARGVELPDGSTSVTGEFSLIIPRATPAVPVPGPTPDPIPVPAEPFGFGVNLSGGENGSPPGLYGNTHIYPNEQEAIYYKAKGFNTIRVPFQWERLQPALNGLLNQVELDRLILAIDPFLARDIVVILDPHNYGERIVGGVKHPVGSAGVPTADFLSFWIKLAQVFKSDSLVWFGLMNEPHRQTAAEWAAIAQAATNAIRATGATNKILVPGTTWTGAHSWVTSGNAAALASFNDPGNNFAFEMHQYLDHDSSGTHMDVTPGAGSNRLIAATEWLRARGAKGFLGEFGWTKDPRRHDAALEGKALLDYVNANRDVWIGWAYWAGGDWFSGADTSVEPENPGVDPDHPQMHVLRYAMGAEEWNPPAGPTNPVNLETRPNLDWSRLNASVNLPHTAAGWTRISDNGENSEHRLEGPIHDIWPDLPIAVEMTLRNESRGYARIGAVSGDAPWQLFRADIDLVTGDVGNAHALNGAEVLSVSRVYRADNDGGGSWRIRVVGKLGQAGRGRGSILLMSAPNTLVYAGNGAAILAKDAAFFQPA